MTVTRNTVLVDWGICADVLWATVKKYIFFLSIFFAVPTPNSWRLSSRKGITLFPCPRPLVYRLDILKGVYLLCTICKEPYSYKSVFCNILYIEFCLYRAVCWKVCLPYILCCTVCRELAADKSVFYAYCTVLYSLCRAIRWFIFYTYCLYRAFCLQVCFLYIQWNNDCTELSAYMSVFNTDCTVLSIQGCRLTILSSIHTMESCLYRAVCSQVCLLYIQYCGLLSIQGCLN